MIYQKLKIVYFSYMLISVSSSIANEQLGTPHDFLLCRHCGYNIAPATAVVNIKSPAAESFDNQTLFGLDNVAVQALRNPLGVQFNVITANGATCIGSNKWQVEHSWFPGYAWKLCTCPRCSKHIGWMFEPLATAKSERVFASPQGFYAFILENVISEIDADSLLITPKSYAFR